MAKVLGLEYEDLAAVFKGIGNIAGVVSAVREQDRQQQQSFAKQQADLEWKERVQAGIQARHDATQERLGRQHTEQMDFKRSSAARSDDRYHRDKYERAEDDARKQRTDAQRFNALEDAKARRFRERIDFDKLKHQDSQSKDKSKTKRPQPISDATLFKLWNETMTPEQQDQYGGDFLEYRDQTLRNRYSYDPRTEGVNREKRGTGDFRRQEAADDRAAGANQGSAFPDGYNRYSAAQPPVEEFEDYDYNDADFEAASEDPQEPQTFEDIVARAETEISDWAQLDEETRVLILDIMMEEAGLEIK